MDDHEESRAILLRHYEGKIREHGYNLLTLVIAGFAGLTLSIQLSNSYCLPFISDNKTWSILLFSATLGIGIPMGIYTFGRFYYWMRACEHIIKIKPKTPVNLTNTKLQVLDEAVRNRIKETWFLKCFIGRPRELLVVILFCIVLTVLLIFHSFDYSWTIILLNISGYLILIFTIIVRAKKIDC